MYLNGILSSLWALRISSNDVWTNKCTCCFYGFAELSLRPHLDHRFPFLILKPKILLEKGTRGKSFTKRQMKLKGKLNNNSANMTTLQITKHREKMTIKILGRSTWMWPSADNTSLSLREIHFIGLQEESPSFSTSLFPISHRITNNNPLKIGNKEESLESSMPING